MRIITQTIKCLDDSRSQGTLTKGNMYSCKEIREHTTKFGVTRDELLIKNNNDDWKWYARDRFDASSVPTTTKTPVVGSTSRVTGIVKTVIVTPPAVKVRDTDFKIGDRVRVRQWDDMVAEYGLDGSGVDIQCLFVFGSGMKNLCGHHYRIDAINSDGEVFLNPLGKSPSPSMWSMSVDMIEKVKEKTTEKEEESAPMPEKEKTAGKMTLRSFLVGQGVADKLVDELMAFRKEHNVDEHVADRIVRKPSSLYFGGSVWSQAIAALLGGNNILLEGEKATGKNVLAENLAFAFGRPIWDISMHVNIDSSALIGSESFKNDEVCFRPGAVHDVATYGGFGVLDEVNMAKNEAVAVLHAVLDDRGVIDVPGYDRIHLDEATRFIATMNYGYVGTRELNEALVSRFVVIHVPSLNDAGLKKLLNSKFDNLNQTNLGFFVKVFTDLQTKAKNGEISTRSVDLRGIIDSLKMIDLGIAPATAVECCVVNKCFDDFEKNKVHDVVKTLIPSTWDRDDVFTDGTPSKTKVAVDFSKVR